MTCAALFIYCVVLRSVLRNTFEGVEELSVRCSCRNNCEYVYQSPTNCLCLLLLIMMFLPVLLNLDRQFSNIFQSNEQITFSWWVISIGHRLMHPCLSCEWLGLLTLVSLEILSLCLCYGLEVHHQLILWISTLQHCCLNFRVHTSCSQRQPDSSGVTRFKVRKVLDGHKCTDHRAERITYQIKS